MSLLSLKKPIYKIKFFLQVHVNFWISSLKTKTATFSLTRSMQLKIRFRQKFWLRSQTQSPRTTSSGLLAKAIDHPVNRIVILKVRTTFVCLRLSQVRLGQVRLGQVRLDKVRLDQIRLGQLRLGQQWIQSMQEVCFLFLD